MLTRVSRLRRVGSPDVVDAALSRWAVRNNDVIDPRVGARVLLTVAGVVGLVLVALGLPDLSGRSVGGHVGLELQAFEAAVAVSFLLASCRPDRYAHSLFPFIAVATFLTWLPAAAQITSTGLDVREEASHLVMLLGLVGLGTWRFQWMFSVTRRTKDRAPA